MDNVSKIVDYFVKGENAGKRLGVEIEFFVCDDNGSMISFEQLGAIMERMAVSYAWDKLCEDGRVIGLLCHEYVVTLEPAGQLEVSMNPFAEIEKIAAVYREFRAAWEPVLAESGFHLLEKGVFPAVENGEMNPEEIRLIPKKRYYYMDRYFETTGKHGKYMMRATASTQVSIDYSSMADAVRKIRILEKMAPFLTLLMENQSGMGKREEWNPHLFRMQIWNDVDGDRCGYIPGSLEPDFSYERYARNVYQKPFIVLNEGNDMIGVGGKSAEQYLAGKEIDFVEHLLTMFFYHVRLKKYIEIRFADSVPEKRMLGYVALIKGLMYSEESLAGLETLFEEIGSIRDICEIEHALSKEGYYANIGGMTAVEWLFKIYEIARGNLSETDRKYLTGVLTLPMLEYDYQKNIAKESSLHGKSFFEYKEYMLNSTAKYHGRVARTMYLPKIFTRTEVEIFRENVEQLFGIFDKVIAEYERNADFRDLFGFDERLEELILREKNYECNIPIARIDIFYNEQTGNYKFCEFNTDGSSAMNEDRELNNGLKYTRAYEEFSGKYTVKTFELFDTWVDEFLSIYASFAKKKGREQKPGIAIVDFLEHATINEFKIFKERFTERGIACEICDIRELTYDGQVCRTPDGMQVDAVYRRAVTSDILHHFEEVGDFLEAVKAGAVCLIGDFRTQIAHNKILYKVLHLPQVQEMFSEKERNFIKAHVPYTVSLGREILEQNPNLWKSVRERKNDWIIKPEDSYGSLGVHAGVECNEQEWLAFVEEAMDQHYILQEFCHPYQLQNVEWNVEDEETCNRRMTSNLTGMYVYNGKLKGLYSRISYDEMISTQYNEMSLPTIIVEL